MASALARTEHEVALVRRKSGGVVRFDRARSLFGAEFVHTTSRLSRDADPGAVPDPQLHSHLILFAAERTDGKLAAIESRRLYRTARENGAFYRAELAANLRELGLPIERRTGRGARTSSYVASPRSSPPAGPLAPRTSSGQRASFASATAASRGPGSSAR